MSTTTFSSRSGCDEHRLDRGRRDRDRRPDRAAGAGSSAGCSGWPESSSARTSAPSSRREFLSGRESPYTPLVALGGAAVLVILFQSIASMAGSAIRTSLFVLPPLRWLDSLGGLVLGAVAGAAIVWVLGAVALHLPGQRELREDVQRSRILGEINERVPPSRLLDAIARVDPFLTIRGPQANVAPPDPALLASPGVRAAARQRLPGHRQRLRPRRLRLRLGRGAEPRRHERPRRRRDEGSRASTAATATTATRSSSPSTSATTSRCSASPVSGRRRSSRSRRWRARPSRSSAIPRAGRSPPPRDGSARRAPSSPRTRTGAARSAARSRRCAATSATATRAGRRSTSAGRVQTTVFASRIGVESQGYGVPTELVRATLADARDRGSVSTGPCVR